MFTDTDVCRWNVRFGRNTCSKSVRPSVLPSKYVQRPLHSVVETSAVAAVNRVDGFDRVKNDRPFRAIPSSSSVVRDPTSSHGNLGRHDNATFSNENLTREKKTSRFRRHRSLPAIVFRPSSFVPKIVPSTERRRWLDDVNGTVGGAPGYVVRDEKDHYRKRSERKRRTVSDRPWLLL